MEDFHNMRLTQSERVKLQTEAREKLNFEKFEEQLQKLIKRFSGQTKSHDKLNPRYGSIKYPLASSYLEVWSKFEFPKGDKIETTEEKDRGGRPIDRIGGLTKSQLRRYERSKVHYESLRDHLYKFIKSV
tara:strand:- start:99 stop:488 length:390 start_codon:yes stop_codon:yes gene_type:complete